MKINAIFLVVYSLLVLIGGIVGYVVGNSLPSLVAGGISGVLLLTCCAYIYKNSMLALNLSLVVLIALLCFFSYRYTVTMKFAPSGIMAILTFCTLSFLAFRRGLAKALIKG